MNLHATAVFIGSWPATLQTHLLVLGRHMYRRSADQYYQCTILPVPTRLTRLVTPTSQLAEQFGNSNY